MEWHTCLRKTLQSIEANLEGEIDIGALSKQVFVSPYYLQKGFKILTGFSLGEYIRNRKLYEAGKALSTTDEKIIDVALRFGYETPESFSKAFTRFHGISPAAVRKNPRSLRVFLPLNIRIEIFGGDKMDYEVSTLWGFKVIGFERTFAYETANRDIPAFWDEICEKYCNHTIYAGKAPSCPQEQAIMDNCIGEYGVIIDDVGEGHFRYLIAGKYTGGDVPEGMSTYTFPKGEWAIFQSVGAVPEALQALNTRVFKEWLPGNPDYELGGAYCVEHYDCTGEKTDADYRSSLWIPVRAYQAEAEKRWGETEAFKESAARTDKRSREENDAIHAGLMAVFERFGAVRDVSPSDESVRTLVAELQNYISRHYYTCTDEMLKNLGLMYSADERFKANIDRKGGEGTAAFISEAIKVYFE